MNLKVTASFLLLIFFSTTALAVSSESNNTSAESNHTSAESNNTSAESNNSSVHQDRRHNRTTTLVTTDDIGDEMFDIVIVVTNKLEKLKGDLSDLKASVENYTKIDSAYFKQPVLIITEAVPSGRLIYTTTEPLQGRKGDVKTYANAAKKGIQRAVDAGCERPLLVIPEDGPYESTFIILSALEILYVPYDLREVGHEYKVEMLGVWFKDLVKGSMIINMTRDVEVGRIIARDIATGDPEMMSPGQVEIYIREAFRGSDIQMEVLSDIDTLKKDYPMLAAVSRAANVVPRHRARLIYLEYIGSNNINTTLFLLGKGTTMDTGGVSMISQKKMSAEGKTGAAGVAGFMKVLSLLKPRHLKVVAVMAMVRNSVGEESFVVDELITSRARGAVRITNTAASNLDVMGDVLCKMVGMAEQAVNPEMMSMPPLRQHEISSIRKRCTVTIFASNVQSLKIRALHPSIMRPYYTANSFPLRNRKLQNFISFKIRIFKKNFRIILSIK
ncbi:Sb:cb283 protein [Plakobranchus ocellatus]|uniref:Sb:cb283 protein n=1 Tax=Plakobranchus ocellatus TaxID=259542 RepID=A0AAV4C031_9GAST|nr:Sb:cb283 protein [Plakobranchus ocellatus]